MDLERVELLIKLMKNHKLSELELKEGKDSIRLVLAQKANFNSNDSTTHLNHLPFSGSHESVQLAVPANLSQNSLSTSLNQPNSLQLELTQSKAANFKEIRSPFVGTFYCSASPSSQAFVEIGSRVKKGDTLCIVEAMKLMNEIEADCDGVIVKILVSNESPIEYNQLLFLIE